MVPLPGSVLDLHHFGPGCVLEVGEVGEAVEEGLVFHFTIIFYNYNNIQYILFRPHALT